MAEGMEGEGPDVGVVGLVDRSAWGWKAGVERPVNDGTFLTAGDQERMVDGVPSNSWEIWVSAIRRWS